MFWQYEKCIECFQKSLSINSLQVSRAHILTYIFFNFYTSTFLSSTLSYTLCFSGSCLVYIWLCLYGSQEVPGGCKSLQTMCQYWHWCKSLVKIGALLSKTVHRKLKIRWGFPCFYRTLRPGITWHQPTYNLRTSRLS